MEVLSVPEAADYIGLSESFLNKRRVYGGGPLYIKVGRRVVYDRDHLDSWMLDRTVANTSQILGAAS
jgi:predicted DNA-binding transcriptional regulator AlpA